MSEDRVSVADILFRSSQIKGEVGIEIEVEGRRLPMSAGDYWTVTRDGSLRGEEALEYVLAQPIAREEVGPALAQLYKRFASCKSAIEDSGRAGVHVHINIRDLTISELYTFIFLYLILERPLTNLCGQDRVGNLFCLRAVDAEYLLVALRDVVKNHEFRLLRNDNLRYAAINLTAIGKYGSLEFRAMASPVEQAKIEQWASILLTIKDAVKQFKSPVDVVSGVSHYGGVDFAKSILGEHFENVPCEDWNDEVTFGMRLIQPIVNNFSEKSLEKLEKNWVKGKLEEQVAAQRPHLTPEGSYTNAFWSDALRDALEIARPGSHFGEIKTQ